MAAYESQSVKGLQALLRDRGLNARGRKDELIQRLLEDDVCAESNTVLHADPADDEDSDVQVTAHVGNAVADRTDSSQESNESEAIKILKLQIELEKIKLQQSQVGMNAGSGNSSLTGDKLDMSTIKARLPVMSPDCDVIAFFLMLEKTLELNAVPKELWAKILPSVLNERAGKVFAQQSIDCCRDYDRSRALLINAFKCGSDVYLRKLHTSRRTGNESYTMFLNRLAEYQSFYLQSRSIVDFDALKDDVLMNCFMLSLKEDVVEFVKGRQPTNASEAAAAADLCYSVRSKSKMQGHAAHQSSGRNQWVRPQGINSAKPQEFKFANDNATASSAPVDKKGNKGEQGKLKACWSCGSLSHKRAECPTTAQPTSRTGKRNGRVENSAFMSSNLRHNANERFVIPCNVMGREASFTAYRDSGASVSLAHNDIVDKSAYTGETISVKGLFGPEVQVPIAVVYIKSPKFRLDDYLCLKVGVVDIKLPFDVDLLIGNDLFDDSGNLFDVIRVEGCLRPVKRVAEAQPVVSGVGCNSNVIVFNGSVDESPDSLSAIETVTDRSVQCDLSRELALPLETEQCLTAVTRSQSTGKDSDMDVTAELPVDKLNTCSAVHLNNRAKRTRKAHADETVRDSSVGYAKQCAIHASDAQHQTTEADVVAVPSLLDTVANCSRPLKGAVGNDFDDTRQSSKNAVEAEVSCKRDSDSQLRAEFVRLSSIDISGVNGRHSEPPTEKQVELANLQIADPKLMQAWQKARVGHGGYFIQNGILFKQKPRHLRSDHEFLLVLPECYKRQVLEIAHDSMTNGGHTAFQRTADKILKVFYMPKREIKQYCASCLVCQRLRPKCIKERADYQIPLISTDFGETFVIDIMGGQLNQLSRRHGNHKYVLVCVEKSTRWVELIPLPSLKAATLTGIIESNLIARFACKTLVYDQQSGFMSELMQSVLKLLRVKSSIAVAAFHATTSIAERYVRTVERYIKPYLDKYQGNWSLILPWISFQLRQAPCSTLKYSAHELTFGRNFPDELDDLRDDLDGSLDPNERKLKKNVLAYLRDLTDRLQITRKLATQNALKQGERTKTWFDRQATVNKRLIPGDKCLILEPTDSRKMHAKWSEPVTILKQTGNRNYEVQLNDGNVKTCHVNQLRKYIERTEFVHAVVIAADLDTNFEDNYLPAIEDEVTEPIKFKIEESLPSDQKECMLKLLTEFKDVFRPNLGKTHLAVHCITLTDDTPCVSKSYRIPETLKQPLEDELNRLLEAGVLRHCSSEYRSPLIPIKKPDGSLRIVNAYQAINAKTKDDLYPMSNPVDILTKAAGKRYITKIDLSKAFLQIPLQESCQEYTAFSCSLGTLCWTRACLGLKNSPRTMQRLMDSLLRGTASFAGCLLDDIVISSDSFDLHLHHLREILSRLHAANLTASLSKSEFLVKSMTVLGHCLEDGVIKPSSKHIDTVLKIGPQTTKHGVRALLGLLNYHRAMIPSFAEITFCLTELLKKHQPDRNIRWQQKHTDALNEIKRILTSKPILIPPKHDRDYIIMSDATDKTIAGVLAQKDDQGIERNVAYFSRKLLPNERNYSVLEKEALGILASCIKWHDWIYGHRVIARTDHRALAFLDSTAQHNARIARWKIILSNYQLTTEYRKGVHHGNCDGLSRVEFHDE